MPKTKPRSPKPTRPTVRGVPFDVVTNRRRRLHVPHRSRHVPAGEWRDYPRPVPEAWARIARDKGFRVHGRIRDRYHVALECDACGGLTAHKSYTLRTAQPRCGACAEADLGDAARAASLTFLRRDDRNHHYGLYRAACGHVIKRQFEFVERVAAKLTDVRCEKCLRAREQDEASQRGWERLGRDPQGNANYRMYRHSCGHSQRVARVNMAWDQVKCAACGGAWNSTASFIYLARIEMTSRGIHLLKLGFSKTPVKRLKHQLGLPRSAKVDLVRVLPMASGHVARAQEAAVHAILRRRHPDAVVPPEVYAGILNVASEVYEAFAFDLIMRHLDRIEAAHPPT
ncbi:hypothetical protein [Marivita cryptomonadis]|jgi:hypothetical protein|uniref:hypothetical protein n=1 Tax=Marivita cryptomonadis TaxID=505252 RepID=UPI000A1DCC8F|nr:hypothetical protein [Marivita cryptomonadis]